MKRGKSWKWNTPMSDGSYTKKGPGRKHQQGRTRPIPRFGIKHC